MIAVHDNGFIPESAAAEGYDNSRKAGAYPIADVIGLADRAIARDAGQPRPTSPTGWRTATRSSATGPRRGCSCSGPPARRPRRRCPTGCRRSPSPRVTVVVAEALARLGQTGPAVSKLAIHPGRQHRLAGPAPGAQRADLRRRARAGRLPAIRRTAASSEDYLHRAGRYLELVLTGDVPTPSISTASERTSPWRTAARRARPPYRWPWRRPTTNGGRCPSPSPARDAAAVTRRMVSVPAGEFRMGGADADAFPADGEGPVRVVRLSAYAIDATAVSNARFAAFVKATGYVTDAERYGWSYVFHRPGRTRPRPCSTAWCPARRGGGRWQGRPGGARRAAARTSPPGSAPGRARVVARRHRLRGLGRQAAADRGASGRRRPAAGWTRRGSRGATSSTAARAAPVQHLAGRFPVRGHGGDGHRRHRAGGRLPAQRVRRCSTPPATSGSGARTGGAPTWHAPDAPGHPGRPAGPADRRDARDPRRLVPVPRVVLQPLPGRRPHAHTAGQHHRPHRIPLRGAAASIVITLPGDQGICAAVRGRTGTHPLITRSYPVGSSGGFTRSR